MESGIGLVTSCMAMWILWLVISKTVDVPWHVLAVCCSDFYPWYLGRIPYGRGGTNSSVSQCMRDTEN